MKKKYDILQETYCLYCQKEFNNCRKFQNHINKKHLGSYTHGALQRALHAKRIDPGVAAAQRES